MIWEFPFVADVASTLPASVQKLQVSSAAHQKQQELLKQVAEQQFVPKEPPPEPEFVADPPSISALDLYVFILLMSLCFNLIAILIDQAIFLNH